VERQPATASVDPADPAEARPDREPNSEAGRREARSTRAVSFTDLGIGVFLVGGAAVVVSLIPRLIAARMASGFPPTSAVAGIPVAWHGIFFFTILALGLTFALTLWRGASLPEAAILAIAGLGAFELLYGVAYATTTSHTELLALSPGLPVTGWAGFGTWLLVEFLVGSFALIGWDRAGVDRFVVAAGLLFLVGMTLWDLWLDWWYPPYQNTLGVFLVITLAEVSGSLFSPLIVTARPKQGRGLLGRVWGRVARLLPN
jgi:hypothetical protein